MTELERDTLDRVTGHLETWANDHPDERTSEIDAAIYCARQLLRASLSPAATPVSEAEPGPHREAAEQLRSSVMGALCLAVCDHTEAHRLADYVVRNLAWDAALAKPASSPADVVQTLIDKTEKLIEAADDMAWSCNSSSADQAIREARDAVRAALSPSTSAGRGE